MPYDYTQLQADVIGVGKRSDYAGAKAQRFIAEGEVRIRARLEAQMFSVTLGDASRPSTSSAVFNLPNLGADTVDVRSVQPVDASNNPIGDQLEKVDVRLIVSMRSLSQILYWSSYFDSQIQVAGVPAAGTNLIVGYWGMPARLADTTTNVFLQQNQLLYLDAALVSLFMETENYEARDRVLAEMNGLIDELNRKAHKKTSGGRSSPAYNTNFRSSY
jgi:hypothetical protein